MPQQRHHMPQASEERGRQIAMEVGCGSCHQLPGVAWPAGRLGPSLVDFAGQGMIVGRLPNTPDVLASFVRDAPSLSPDTLMPAMPIDQQDARDIAAYLYASSGG
ncbi:MAG: cytochrome c family protein [Sphingomonadaceae bacterium]